MTWTSKTKASYFRNHPEGRRLLSEWHRNTPDLEVVVFYLWPDAQEEKPKQMNVWDVWAREKM